MAEKNDGGGDLENVEGGEKPKSSFKKILILLLLAALGGGGYYAYITYGKPLLEKLEKMENGETEEGTNPDGASADGQPAKKAEEETGAMVSLEPFIVNLAGSQGKRFLKVAMTLEFNSPEAVLEYKDNLQKIIDSILVLLSSKNFEDVYSVQGKFKLKDEITARSNRFLVMGHIKEVYFTEFVIQ